MVKVKGIMIQYNVVHLFWSCPILPIALLVFAILLSYFVAADPLMRRS